MRQAGGVNGGGPMQNTRGNAPRGYYVRSAMPCRGLAGSRLRPSRAGGGECGAFMHGALRRLGMIDSWDEQRVSRRDRIGLRIYRYDSLRREVVGLGNGCERIA